jgi:hypothetical protein
MILPKLEGITDVPGLKSWGENLIRILENRFNLDQGTDTILTDIDAIEAEIDTIQTELDTKLGLPLPLLYAGCNAGSIDSTHMYFNPGSVANSDGSAIITFLTTLEINLAVDGITSGSPILGSSSTWIGGMDTGATPPASGTNLHFYLLTQDSDGAPAVCASEAAFYGDFTPITGWTVQRKLHFSCIYHTGRGANWAGIPDFFQDIDNQFVYLTGSGEDTNYMALNAGTSATFFTFSLSTFVPDPNRTALVWVVAESTGADGWVAVRPPGIGQGRFVYCPAGHYGSAEILLKTDSLRAAEYLASNANAYVYLIGYKFDDPT